MEGDIEQAIIVLGESKDLMPLDDIGAYTPDGIGPWRMVKQNLLRACQDGYGKVYVAKRPDGCIMWVPHAVVEKAFEQMNSFKETQRRLLAGGGGETDLFDPLGDAIMADVQDSVTPAVPLVQPTDLDANHEHSSARQRMPEASSEASISTTVSPSISYKMYGGNPPHVSEGKVSRESETRLAVGSSTEKRLGERESRQQEQKLPPKDTVVPREHPTTSSSSLLPKGQLPEGGTSKETKSILKNKKMYKLAFGISERLSNGEMRRKSRHGPAPRVRFRICTHFPCGCRSHRDGRCEHARLQCEWSPLKGTPPNCLCWRHACFCSPLEEWVAYDREGRGGLESLGGRELEEVKEMQRALFKARASKRQQEERCFVRGMDDDEDEDEEEERNRGVALRADPSVRRPDPKTNPFVNPPTQQYTQTQLRQSRASGDGQEHERGRERGQASQTDLRRGSKDPSRDRSLVSKRETAATGAGASRIDERGREKEKPPMDATAMAREKLRRQIEEKKKAKAQAQARMSAGPVKAMHGLSPSPPDGSAGASSHKLLPAAGKPSGAGGPEGACDNSKSQGFLGRIASHLGHFCAGMRASDADENLPEKKREERGRDDPPAVDIKAMEREEKKKQQQHIQPRLGGSGGLDAFNAGKMYGRGEGEGGGSRRRCSSAGLRGRISTGSGDGHGREGQTVREGREQSSSRPPDRTRGFSVDRGVVSREMKHGDWEKSLRDYKKKGTMS